MARRSILHVDMDAFFASVEQRDRPELRGKPVIVGAGPHERGVVSTCSYEARRFGVHSAMPSREAFRLCPHGIFLPPDGARYMAASARVFEIFDRYTPLVQGLSCDEAFLDVSGAERLFGDAVSIARRIRADIARELRLTASVGVAPNKFLAKVASDLDKPDGLTVIHPARAQAFINQLRVERLWGVGPRTAEALHRYGIFTGKDLHERSLFYLTERFGKMGAVLYNFARGIDNRPVQPTRIRKSVGCERTFEHDLQHEEEFEEALAQAADELVRRLERTHFQGQTLTLKVKFADFHQITRSLTLEGQQTIAADADAILPLARQLFYDSQAAVQSVRLIGLTVSYSASQESALAHALAENAADGLPEHWVQLELPFRPWEEEDDE